MLVFVPIASRWFAARLRPCAGLWLCVWAFSAIGCTRAMYRESADRDVYGVVAEKSQDPRWHLQNYTIDINPHSRMYDGFDPDNEPLPPDDPSSNVLMHRIDGMKGYPCWNLNGQTDMVENLGWMETLPRGNRGEVLVDLDNAVRLGLLHSRDYQKELEDLYLSALDVTFERFRFDVQFFGGNDTFFTADGPLRNGNGQSTSTLTTDSNLQARKLFASGGQLVVDVANSIVWQFSGPDTNVTSTLLDFSFVQPLLRGGVKSQTLERLTLSERTLLANVRAMERYRSGFYLNLATGRDAGQGPQRRGGVFSGGGLSGFTGLSGGFSNVSGTATQGANNTNTSGGAGAGQAGGFLGLLQTQLQLRNQEANVAALADSLAQLQAAYDATRIDRFQVDFGRQALFNARSQLLQAKTNYQNTQDAYKITLGLPPYVDFQIDDPLLSPFQLIDPSFPPLQNRLTRAQEALGPGVIGLLEATREPAGNPAAENVIRTQIAELRAALATARDVHRLSQRQFAATDLDLRDLSAAIPERRVILKKLEARDVALQSRTSGESQRSLAAEEVADTQDPLPVDAPGGKPDDEFALMIRQLEALPNKLRGELGLLAQSFARYPQEWQRLDAELAAWNENPALLTGPAGQARMNAVLGELPDFLVNFSGDLLELSLIQARARAESVNLLPVELDPADALSIAAQNRRDWMNARASLVDTWRLIEFNANALESQLDLVFGGDIRTVGNNPVDFRSATGRLRAGVQFDAPLTRVAERNNYRQALIEYQQARRSYYLFVDRVNQSLRTGLRQVELDQANFELRRAAVRVAIDQVEVTRLRLREPPKPGVVATFSPTTARDLVSALGDLLNVQNDFMSVWVNFEVERMTLDFNMDTMQVDAEGLWIDPGAAIGLSGLRSLECVGRETEFVDDDAMWRRAENEGREAMGPPKKDAKHFAPVDEPEAIPPGAARRRSDTDVIRTGHAEPIAGKRTAAERRESTPHQGSEPSRSEPSKAPLVGRAGSPGRT